MNWHFFWFWWTLWLPQKNQNSCQHRHFLSSEYTEKAFASGALPLTILGKFTAPPDLLAEVGDHFSAVRERGIKKGEDEREREVMEEEGRRELASKGWSGSGPVLRLPQALLALCRWYVIWKSLFRLPDYVREKKKKNLTSLTNDNIINNVNNNE